MSVSSPCFLSLSPGTSYWGGSHLIINVKRKPLHMTHYTWRITHDTLHRVLGLSKGITKKSGNVRNENPGFGPGPPLEPHPLLGLWRLDHVLSHQKWYLWAPLKLLSACSSYGSIRPMSDVGSDFVVNYYTLDFINKKKGCLFPILL